MATPTEKTSTETLAKPRAGLRLRTKVKAGDGGGLPLLNHNETLVVRR